MYFWFMMQFLNGFGYAFKGVAYAISTQLNFKIHLIATIIAVALGYYLKISIAEWCWIIACIALVLIVELLNTAIELLTDIVSPEFNVKAGHLKDVSAAAVLITAIFALLIGAIIFIPKF